MKSIHGAMKAISAVYTMIGRDIGSPMWMKVCHLVAPSISAASSMARGMVSKNPLAT